MTTSINEFNRVNRNLYKYNNRYFRLFGKSVTPNGCWIVAPVMKELRDIDVATGKDVFGSIEIKFDVVGTVQAGREFITY